MRHVVAVVALTLLACATSDVMRVGPRLMPTQPEDIQVFIEEPGRGYRVVGMVEASDQGWELGLKELRAKIVKDAARLGGQAVILGQKSTDTSGATSTTTFTPIGSSVQATTTTATVTVTRTPTGLNVL